MEIPSSNSRSISIPGREGESFDYLSTTPGGTIYGTTPGGSKIKYSRDALLFIRNSPLSKTPPSNLPVIPGITAPGSLAPSPNPYKKTKPNNNNNSNKSPRSPRHSKVKEQQQEVNDDSEELFAMD